jgi:hypothetical protein
MDEKTNIYKNVRNQVKFQCYVFLFVFKPTKLLLFKVTLTISYNFESHKKVEWLTACVSQVGQSCFELLMLKTMAIYLLTLIMFSADHIDGNMPDRHNNNVAD